MPSRRSQIKMDKQELREFLEQAKTLIVVSNGRDGYPHPMPMWFCVDEYGALYCTTFAKSQKVLNWKSDPKASLLVESGENYAELEGVVIYASAEIIDQPEAVVDTLVRIGSKGKTPSQSELESLRNSVAKLAKKRVVLKFVPERYVSWDHRKLGGAY